MKSGAEIIWVEESIQRLLEAYVVPHGEVFAILTADGQAELP